jgi:hypothetical protein
VVRFHGFANLTTTRDEFVDSPEFSCFGHRWRLRLYPEEDSPEGYVALRLGNRSNTSIKIQWSYSVKDVDGKEVVYHEPDTDKFDACGGRSSAWTTTNFATTNFAERSKLMNDYLAQGSLVIEVRIKLVDTSITQFIPTNPIIKNVLKLFMDEETADVVFEVGGQQQTKGKRKKAFAYHQLLCTQAHIEE